MIEMKKPPIDLEKVIKIQKKLVILNIVSVHVCVCEIEQHYLFIFHKFALQYSFWVNNLSLKK